MNFWQRTTGKNATDTLDLASFENKEWMIFLRSYLPNNTPLQTVGLLNGRVTAPKQSIAVNGRVEDSYVLVGSKLVIQGVVV